MIKRNITEFFRIKRTAQRISMVNDDEIKLQHQISRDIRLQRRVFAKIRIGNERLWVIVIGEIQTDKKNTDFIGLVDNIPFSNPDLKLNDFIKFHSYDVIEIESDTQHH